MVVVSSDIPTASHPISICGVVSFLFLADDSYDIVERCDFGARHR